MSKKSPPQIYREAKARAEAAPPKPPAAPNPGAGLAADCMRLNPDGSVSAYDGTNSDRAQKR